MKFIMALLTYLGIAGLLGCGILLAIRGNPWLLIISFLGYATLFALCGCLPAKSQH